LTQLGNGNAATYFPGKYIEYGMDELKVLPVFELQMSMVVAAPVPPTLGDLMESDGILP